MKQVLCREMPSTSNRAQPGFKMLQMTARVLESLEDKDGAAFAAACESLWGQEPRRVSDVEKNPTPTTRREVRVMPSISIPRFACPLETVLPILHTGCVRLIPFGVSKTPRYAAFWFVFPNCGFAEITLAFELIARNLQVPPRPQSDGKGLLPPTTLKGAMGNWRPSVSSTGRGSNTRTPPAAVTGVAPWAFKSPKPPTRLGGTARLQTTADGVQRVKPPVQSLKRLR